MKMIDVLNMMAQGEIKEGAKLKIGGEVYSYIDTYTDYSGCCSFVNEEGYSDTFLEDKEMITQHFLNFDVELIPPKEKKYFVKLNVHGLREDFAYLNYFDRMNRVMIRTEEDYEVYKTRFTKDELKSIQPVREFLEDMQGKYELIVVYDNETD